MSGPSCRSNCGLQYCINVCSPAGHKNLSLDLDLDLKAEDSAGLPKLTDKSLLASASSATCHAKWHKVSLRSSRSLLA